MAWVSEWIDVYRTGNCDTNICNHSGWIQSIEGGKLGTSVSENWNTEITPRCRHKTWNGFQWVPCDFVCISLWLFWCYKSTISEFVADVVTFHNFYWSHTWHYLSACLPPICKPQTHDTGDAIDDLWFHPTTLMPIIYPIKEWHHFSLESLMKWLSESLITDQ